MPPELQFLVIVIALLGFWGIVMRPARLQQRQTAQLQAAIEVGDDVIISAGIFGTITAIEDDQVRLEIAPGTVVTVARQVVVRRAPDAVPAPEPAPTQPDDRDVSTDARSTDED